MTTWIDPRTLEDASDGLARLDAESRVAPRAFSSALWFSAVSQLANAGTKGTRSLVVAFATGADQQADPATRQLEEWRAFMEAEERRARSGAPLTATRLLRAPHAPHSGGTSPTDAEDERGRQPRDAVHRTSEWESALESALRPAEAGVRPPALARAVAIATAVPERDVGEAAAALVLVAEGRADRIRLLPFVGLTNEEWARAARPRPDDAGSGSAYAALALRALVRSCRLKSRAVALATEAMPREDSALDALGRAAITARRALTLLRSDLACTVPWLAAELGLSRPAAGDAIERLAEEGIATEITGRRRDRVFAYTAALDVADA